MSKPNLKESPDRQRPGRPTSSAKKPLIMVAALASSMIAAVVVGLLIINSSAFKSFRSTLAGNSDSGTSKAKAKGERELSNEPVELDPNYDFEADLARKNNRNYKSKNPKSTPKESTNQTPAKPEWNSQAADRQFPRALIKPKTPAERLDQSVLLAISQRKYDEAVELFDALKKDPKNSDTLAFSDLGSRLDSLEKFWQTVRTGQRRCVPSTEIELNGEYVRCVRVEGQDRITFRQSTGAEKSFALDPDLMEASLVTGFFQSVEPDDTAAVDLFLELDFVGDPALLTAWTQSEKRGFAPLANRPSKQTNPSASKPKSNKPKPAVVQESATPVPTKEQQRESLKLIRSLFPDEYADRSDTGKRNLADLLLKQGRNTNDDPVARYTLLQQSLEMAQKSAAGKLAWSAADAIIEDYDVEPFDMKIEVLRELSKGLNDPEMFSTFVGDCQELIDANIELDQYENAVTRSRKLLAVAKKGANEPTVEALEEIGKRIKKFNTAFAAIQDQVALANEQPGNQAANQAAGEFYCFVKGDFEKGLPYLAVGDSAETKAIAKQEINSGNTKQWIVVGDGWWELAENRSTQAELIRAHAGEIYTKIEPELTGLTQKRVQARLAEIQALANKNKNKDTIFESDWTFAWTSQVDWERTRFSEDGTLRIQIENIKEPRSYRWQKTDQGILVQSSKTQHFIILRNGSGQLVGKKFDSTKNIELDSVVATQIQQN